MKGGNILERLKKSERMDKGKLKKKAKKVKEEKELIICAESP